MEKILNTITRFLLFFIIILLPFFFLPITQEYFITNKFYLLGFSALLLFLISNIQYLISKKISWVSLPFDTPMIIFLLTIGLSLIFSSPNKIQALLQPNFGLITFLSLTIIYFYLSRMLKKENLLKWLNFSAVLISLIAIIFFFQPFKNVNLPSNLAFLKNPYFTPLGSLIDLAIFLGFVIVYQLTQIIKIANERNGGNNKSSIIDYSLLIVNLLALSLTLYQIFKPTSPTDQVNVLLPPWRLSWYAAVEVLKKPITALFGVGVDNFSSMFTKIKDLAYNQSNLWQINSFNLSRSALLHILTETGLFGLLAFLLLSLQAVKIANKKEDKFSLFIILYSLLIIILLPPSLITWFLFFISLALIVEEKAQDVKTYDLAEIMPLYLGMAVVWLALIGTGGYLLGRSYAAEVYFKKAIDGFAKNDAKQVYDNMRQAIILNPYIERYRLSFSQLNLLIANNIAAKANQPQENNKKPYQLTEQDRQNITQAVQAAINEAKAAVTLNPQKAENWQNLANIYRNIINTAQGADVWTISSYQRAIVLDPQNPTYRLNLGGLYYSLGNYEEAVKLFEQTIALKPDWANAHYNLAWADYQRQNYQRAVSEMQNVLSLLDPQKDKTDYEKAQKDLEEFKKKLPQEEKEATGEAQTPSKLSLPTPPAATLEPKIKLPETASPEAR